MERGLRSKLSTYDDVMDEDISDVFAHIGKLKEIDLEGNIVFSDCVFTEKDIETIKHIRINNITGEIFDDRKTNI